MSPLRIGLVGLGRHGVRYARHLLDGEVPGAVLAAVCRRDARAGAEWAREHGVAFHPDLASLLRAPDVDAVALVTPVATHRDLALAVLGAGKPLLIEKPLADTAAAADEIGAAAARVGVPCMVAHTLRREPLYVALAELLAQRPGPVSVRYSLAMEPDGEALRSFRGSRLLELGVHILDWLGAVRPASAWRAECTTDAPPPGEREFTIRLRSSGLDARVDFRERPLRDESILVSVGEAVRWLGIRFAHRLIADGKVELPLPPRRATVPVLLGEFADCVRSGGPVPIPPSEGARAVRLAEAAVRSAREHGAAIDVSL